MVVVVFDSVFGILWLIMSVIEGCRGMCMRW